MISFDPESWEFAFRRTVPVGIYVDAGDNSGDLASEISNLVDEVLKESGFEEPEHLGRFYGASILQLNLGRSSAPVDGPTFAERMAGVKNRAIERLRKFPWSEAAQAAGSTIKVAVAIGTLVVILTAVPAAPLVIGSFVVPAKMWIAIGAAGEGIKMAEEAKSIFLHSKAAAKALGQAEQVTESASPPASPGASEDTVLITDERLKEMQDEVKGLRERIKNMRKPGGAPSS